MKGRKNNSVLIGSLVWFVAIVANIILMYQIRDYGIITSIVTNLQTQIEEIQFDMKLSKLSKENQVQILFTKAELLLKKGRKKEALQAYQEIINLNPKDNLLWLARKRRAYIFRKIKWFDSAITEYSTFIKCHRNMPGLYLGLAYSYRSTLYKKLGYSNLAQRDIIELEQMRQGQQ